MLASRSGTEWLAGLIEGMAMSGPAYQGYARGSLGWWFAMCWPFTLTIVGASAIAAALQAFAARAL